MIAPSRVARALVDHRRIALAFVLVTTLFVGAGVAQLEEESTFESFEVGTTEEAKQEYIESNFTAGDGNETATRVVVRDDNVLEKETLIETLELQQQLRTDDTVEPTLSENRQTAGIANVVATAAIRAEDPSMADPTIEQQIAALEAIDQRQIDAAVRQLLGDQNTSSEAFAFMPNSYEPGSTNANATMIAVFQSPEQPTSPGNAPDAIVEAQTTIQSIAADQITDGETLVVGDGIFTAEMEQSRQDTFQLVGPLALLFVLVTLGIVYRDLFDILLSILGIILVQLWTFGMLGWVGIAFNPVLIAIPVLLIGLSIDYGIHVFMRYRERRSEHGESVGAGMSTALAGVGVALLWVTVTTVVGFLSNLASPLGPIRDLGIISAIGIVGALVIFGGLVPLAKVELDLLTERFGIDRSHRPIGTDGGLAARILSVGSTAARRAPIAVLVVTLLVTGVATVGATNVSTSFGPEDHIAEDPADWSKQLPEPLAPGEYTAKENMQYVNDRFVSHDSQAEILIEGAVTEPETVRDLADAEREAADAETAVTLANGDARTESPLSVIERTAETNESFNATLAAADTDGDGVPDRNIEGVYDELYSVAPAEAERVIHRVDGEYQALLLTVSVDAGAEDEEITEEMRAVAGVVDGEGRTVTATGDPIVGQLVRDHLLETVLVSLLITVLVVLVILAGAYRYAHGSATLGIVTLLPVVFTVSWIIGTMYLIGYPLSVVTTIIASITIGIGIDYSIHVSERFSEELDRTGTVNAAIERTTRGTGAALLGSAVTTAAGFGVLSAAFLPSLQQFGTITALMILYAFLGSVLVLPSMLVLWARYLRTEQATVTESPSVPANTDD